MLLFFCDNVLLLLVSACWNMSVCVFVFGQIYSFLFDQQIYTCDALVYGRICVYEGLCGTYDGNRDNDLLQSDGQMYEGRGLRPDPFSLSWR